MSTIPHRASARHAAMGLLVVLAMTSSDASGNDAPGAARPQRGPHRQPTPPSDALSLMEGSWVRREWLESWVLHPRKGSPMCSTTHKWGSVLLRSLWIKHELPCSYGKHIEPTIANRSVVVARNVLKSVVSGYLYHKSGRECWVDEHGVPNPLPKGGNDWLRHKCKKKKGRARRCE